MTIFQHTKKSLIQNIRAHNAEHAWAWLVCIFFLLLAAALLFSSWLFLNITESLDAPVLSSFENNAARIRAIDESITTTEHAIVERTAFD